TLLISNAARTHVVEAARAVGNVPAVGIDVAFDRVIEVGRVAQIAAHPGFRWHVAGMSVAWIREDATFEAERREEIVDDIALISLAGVHANQFAQHSPPGVRVDKLTLIIREPVPVTRAVASVEMAAVR